jgi:hypothetical protein
VPAASSTMAAARLAVFPTRQNLQVMKVKLTGAKKGHSLLKKKADALSMRLRALLTNILDAKASVGAAFRDGNFALAEVKYAAGDIKPMVIESVGNAQVSREQSPAPSTPSVLAPPPPFRPLAIRPTFCSPSGRRERATPPPRTYTRGVEEDRRRKRVGVGVGDLLPTERPRTPPPLPLMRGEPTPLGAPQRPTPAHPHPTLALLVARCAETSGDTSG